MAEVGRKFDAGKLRFSLVPKGVIRESLRVLESGADKYEIDNWKHVPNAQERYFNALHRHLEAWHEGEPLDPETGLHHLAHAMCCCMFLLWFVMNGETKKTTISVCSFCNGKGVRNEDVCNMCNGIGTETTKEEAE